MRSRVATVVVAVCLAGFVVAASAATAGTDDTASASRTEHFHFEYGPIVIGPGQNRIDTNTARIPQPRIPGWIVGFRPNLTLANGTVPPVEDVHLHHGVWASGARRDATAFPWPERFLGVGEEKTALRLPAGYGYAYRPNDFWWLNYMVHNLTARRYKVVITYDVDIVPRRSAPAGMKSVHPIWMDVQNGSFYPVFDVLKGSGTNGRYTYPDDARAPYRRGHPKNEWTVPERGVLVHTFGHLHPGGLHVDLTLEREGRDARLFASTAKYFEPAGAVSWDVSMTATRPDWAVAVRPGDVLKVSATYDTTRASWYESMGLAVVWMYDGEGGANPFTEKVDEPGVLTHGHLPENDNHGGKQTTLTDPRRAPGGPITPAIGIEGFVYGPSDLTQRAPVPTVAQGQSITFDNLDADGLGVWHSVTACEAPCTASTGIAYPLADAAIPFDSGQLGNAGLPTSGRERWTAPADLPAGTYTYFCRIHPFMRGAFRVVSAD
jgi:plastocyanin